jgi:hypothetical protein
MQTYDIEADGLRGLNAALHALRARPNERVGGREPKGSHAIAVGSMRRSR